MIVSTRLLIIFVKNLVMGTVKTRLAKDVGDANALRIYQHLLAHTREITRGLDCAKQVHYSDFIPEADDWSDQHFQKKCQQGGDLGARMLHAFQSGFDAGYRHIVIIGSDNYELTSGIMDTAFKQLAHHDFVIGPAFDGGYYLLGMKVLHPAIFQDKPWGTDAVYSETTDVINALGVSCYALPMLHDVDTVDDLGTLAQFLFPIDNNP